MEPISIARATPADLPALAELEARVFDYDVISPRQMRYLVSSPSAIVAKAVADETIVGYLILLTRKNSATVRLYSLAVLQEARKSGVGRRLLAWGETFVADNGFAVLRLEQRMSNIPALIFYLTAGYSLYGRRADYYTDGSPALLLRKYIQNGERHDSSCD